MGLGGLGGDRREGEGSFWPLGRSMLLGESTSTVPSHTSFSCWVPQHGFLHETLLNDASALAMAWEELGFSDGSDFDFWEPGSFSNEMAANAQST